MSRTRSTFIAGAVIAVASVVTLVGIGSTREAHAQASRAANCTDASTLHNSAAAETWMTQQISRGRTNFVVGPKEYFCAW